MERTVETKPFVYEPSELLRFTFWMRIRATWWLHALILAAAVALVILTGGPWEMALAMAFGGLALGWLGIWLIFRSQLNGPKNRTVLAPRVVRVSADAYEHTLENGIATKVPLANLVDVREDARWYSLYVTEAMYFLIPKSAFLSAEDEQLFAQRVRGQR